MRICICLHLIHLVTPPHDCDERYGLAMLLLRQGRSGGHLQQCPCAPDYVPYTVGGTLRELQTTLPWTSHYHHDFRASPMAHKDFAHAFLHIIKASGKLAAVVDDAEHKGHDFRHEAVAPYLADLVICALRMANVCPNGVVDLQAAVVARIAAKNPRERS